jgi:mRNA-degrading endonuclease RelE of RelBE toxin-antitoxin system
MIDDYPKKWYIVSMRYVVTMKRSVLKVIRKLPESIQERFRALSKVLEAGGPTGPHAWQSYSKLGNNEYHCHITYHYVACWRNYKGTITIEVYYVGSREAAPY